MLFVWPDMLLLLSVCGDLSVYGFQRSVATGIKIPILPLSRRAKPPYSKRGDSNFGNLYLEPVRRYRADSIHAKRQIFHNPVRAAESFSLPILVPPRYTRIVPAL